MAANISSSSVKPMFQRTCSSRPEEDAAEPGQGAAGDPDERITRFVLMPVADASSGLSDTARIALPCRLRWRNRATASSTTTQIAIETRSRLVSENGPMSTADCTAYSRYARERPPNVYRKM